MKSTIIGVDGSTEHYELSDDEKIRRKELKHMVDGPLEYVAILYKGMHCTLVVNEIGATQLTDRGPLPPNARATSMYWTATILGRTGVPFDPLSDPMVHGVVVLIEKSKLEI